jgi:hypothetical protein
MNQKYVLGLGLLVLVVLMYMSREHFAPDSKVLPPCPAGTYRGDNGLDCRIKGDNMGH